MRYTRWSTSFRILTCTLLGALATCTEDRSSVTGMAVNVSSMASVVLAGAGDIADCSASGDEATAALLDSISGTVFTAGDNAYSDGSATNYSQCYDPSWGRHKARTRPAPGNHDYNTSGATGYFGYWGALAGPGNTGYYSYDIGDWHIVSLNSNVSMSAGSPQEQWLRADLAASTMQCTVAYWHHPRFSSGTHHGSSASTQPLWQALYDAGAEIVISGHEHNYERFAPQSATAASDPATGIREFVAGTGGASHYTTFNAPLPNSEVRNGTTWGVLKLTLDAGSYSWQFVPVAGQTFTDTGSGTCHGPPGGGGISASQSTVSTSPASITAGNNPSTITVTARDGGGNPMSGVTIVLSSTGSGNTVTQPSGVTGVDGIVTGTLSSTAAGQKTVTATGDGILITQTATVTVTPGPVSASQSTVTASPASIPAGGGASTITVTATDALGNPISGATVMLAATGSGNTLSQPADTTNAGGVAMGSLASTAVETKTVSATINGAEITQTAFVTVTPPGSGQTITHSLLASGSNAVNQKIYSTASIVPAPNALVTVAVLSHRSSAAISPTLSGGGMASWNVVASVDFDAISLPLRRLTIFRAMSSAPGNGPITITFASSVSNVQWIVSQWAGVETSGVNGSGAIVQTGSNRTDGANALSVSLAAFGSPNNVTFGVVGVKGSGFDVSSGSGFAEITEVPSGESSALEAEWATNDNSIDPNWGSVLRAALLSIEIKAATGGGAPTVSPSQSTVSATPVTITAGNASTITVTAKDGLGDAMSGVTVTLSSTVGGDVITQPASPTDNTGVTTGTVSATSAGPRTITAVASGVTLNQQPSVTVNAGAPNAGTSTVSASPTSITAGSGISIITVTVRDQYGNPMTGSTVALFATGTGNTVTGGGPTNGNGVATGSLSSTVAELKAISATADGLAITQTQNVTVVSSAGGGITHTLLTSGSNAVNQSVTTTASISPAGNSLITVAVLNHRTPAAISPSLSGGGMTSWSVVATVDFDTIGGALRRLTIFRAMRASPGSGPITITFTNSVSNVQWIVSQWDGVETSGVNGASAIGQTGSNRTNAGNGLAVTLGAFGNANNVAYGIFGVNKNVAAITPGAGFTKIDERPSGENTPGDLLAEWAVNRSPIGATWASLRGGALGVEIKARTGP